MSILSWLVVGLIAGWLANMVMKGNRGLIGDIIIGVMGGLIGGFLSSALLGVDYVTGFNLTSIGVAFLGSVILIAILRLLSGYQPPTPMHR